MKSGDLLNNRYQLLDALGSGGMADVFRARDLTLDRYVAIKVLHEDYSGIKNFQESFRMEARSAANLAHPNIVIVHDFGSDENGHVFIVMEHIPGKDLKSILRQRGRLKLNEAIPLMVQACAGIGYAHRAGLVHCDVKPHNMLVTPDQRLKVTDFGIARALATIKPGEKSDVVWGSPQYFSPEQAAGEAPSPASDVYSLGVVMYEILSGTPPFTAPTPEEMARMHIHAEPIPLNEYVPDVPKALVDIVAKVLSKEPSARYRTADQLGRVLLTFGDKRDEPKPAAPTAAAHPSLTLTPEATNNFHEQEELPPPPPPPVYTPRPLPDPEPAAPPIDIDWISVGLGLLALIAVGGLVPFWMYIWLTYNPPIK